MKQILITAILSENLPEVKRLLEEEPTAIDQKDDDGIWAPFLAARTGNLELMKYIVEYSRASLSEYDAAHRCLLHYAVESGALPVVRYLVEKCGMSPVNGDLEGVTPYELADRLGFCELTSYFEKETGTAYENMYHNPVQTGMHPDPSIVRVGEDYYMVNSSFIFFPCIPISHSRDLIHWHTIGHAITNPEWAKLDHLEGGRGYWAPDISYDRGRFYITATYRMNDDGTVYRKQMVTSSEYPEGPYCEPVFLDEDGIDPSIFTDDDGRKYMLLNRGARIMEISADGRKQIGPAQLLYYGDMKRAPEGPHLLKKDEYYYLFEAEGGTGAGHRVTVSRARTLFGRYEPCPYNPILRQWDEGAMLQRAGHGKLVCTQKGEWYMVYLCARSVEGKYSLLGRETAIDPVTWTQDGWPVVNGLKGPSVLQKKPDLPQVCWEMEREERFGVEDQKDGSWLAPEWMFLRSPGKKGYHLEKGVLFLPGDAEDMNDTACRSVLLRRQTHFHFTAETELVIPDLKEGQDLGLTGYYDENTWLKFGLFRAGEQLVLHVCEWIWPEERRTEAVVLPAHTNRLWLKMETYFLKRTLSYSLDHNEYRIVAVLPNVNYLCDEGLRKGKRFTGAMVGVYVHAGEQELTGEFADFTMHCN